MSGLTAGMPSATAPLTGAEVVQADTNLANGLTPQTEIITIEQVKGYAVGGNYANPATAALRAAAATAGAATLNSGYGVITSESLTTAAGATYTLTLTNAAIAAADIVLVSVGKGTSTAGTATVSWVTPAAGSVVIIVQNIHASNALNGTIKLAFSVVKG